MVTATFGKLMTKIFGSRNERLLKRYRGIVARVNALEPKIQAMTDDQLRARTAELREGLTAKKLRSADVMEEAFAIIRESMDRNIGIRSIFNPDENFDPDQFDDEMLQAYDEVQQKMIQTGEPWQRVSIPPRIYEAVRKIYPDSRPPFRARPFDVQLIGGLVLYEGKIAEMATGEGKTFVAPLACFMRVLEGFHCHVVTVNDYLVRRDASWIRPAMDNLGISVGYIQSDMDPGGEARRTQYECDITYGTNSEFGFDYLRDNMKVSAAEQVQGPLDFVIVDEVDSILIDEARTPLIISGAAHDDAPKYVAADLVARKVIELNRPWTENEKKIDAARRIIKGSEGDIEKARGDKPKIEEARKRKEAAEAELAQLEANKKGLKQYYEVELDRKSVHLTHDGIAAAQDAAGVGSFYVGNNMEWPHLMEQAMRAHVVYEKDKDYVVEREARTGQIGVIIVDEYTGRKMEGRQWSDGLHQAVEAKEKVKIKEETQTLATITLQNFFKLYRALSGMTGTAMTEAEEFSKIYKLDVVTIPTNRPVIREDHEDRVYRSEAEKWTAIIEEIKEESQKGRPVLVGTTSVEKSEMLSHMLKRKYGIEHEVLNAKHHEREASIVAQAGQQHKNAHGELVGNVTIATNMAGRGTDIKPVKEALAAGGLHVVATERHTARRIDNQLRGRSGRQGDPGSSRFYVSLQDDLMKMFAGDWVVRVLGWLGMEEGMAIEDKRITKGILRAQKKVEERNYLARKQLLEYDEVNDFQRTSFYGLRQQVLEGRDVDGVIWGMINDAIKDAVDKYVTQDYTAVVVAEWAKTNFEVQIDPYDLRGMTDLNELEAYVKEQAENEAATTITATLDEFMGEDDGVDEADGDGRPAPAAQNWDTKGLSSWAMSRFQVNLPQSQIKRMTKREVDERLRAAAVEQIEKRDASGLAKYVEPLYPEAELASWAREKFDIQIDPKEFVVEDGRTRRSAEEIVELIQGRARAAYARREIEYPVDHTLTYAFGSEDGTTDNPYAADYVRGWAKVKYGVDLSLEHIRGQSLRRLRDELIGHQERVLADGELEKQVDGLLAAVKDAGVSSTAALAAAVNERYQTRLTAQDLTPDTIAERAADEPTAPRTQRDVVLKIARQFYRAELTNLEQFVLIQIFDQSWKDHLYAMDILRSGVGLIAFAEKDPRIIFKKEGYRYFQEMMSGVRDKVTDLIFRARIGRQTEARSAYRETAAVHEDTGGYGVGENVQRTAAELNAGAPPTEEVASGGGGDGETAVAVKPIVNATPKVGRNDPCPCGSGKKYKKCHGQEAA
jgi:preprotein translocase subunit SecA